MASRMWRVCAMLLCIGLLLAGCGGRRSETVKAEAELDAAKTYLTGSYPLRFDGNGPIANILVGMQSEGLPVSYVNDRNSFIEAVTLDDVKRVAKRLMDADALRFVVVGQPAGLMATD